jgi:hypothetical protein
MTGTKMTMMAVRQLANLSHAISVAYVMDGCIHGPMILAQLFVVTTWPEVLSYVMMAIHTIMTFAMKTVPGY